MNSHTAGPASMYAGQSGVMGSVIRGLLFVVAGAIALSGAAASAAPPSTRAGGETGSPRVRRVAPTLDRGLEQHVVSDGDTLWSLAERYMGDPDRWPLLWSYNPHIRNPHWIYPGVVVWLVPGQAGVGSVRSEVAVPVPTASSSSSPRRSAQPQTSGRSSRVRLVKRSVGTSVEPGVFRLRERAYLDADALEGAGVIDAAPVERVMLLPMDEVFVRFEAPTELAPGTQLTLFDRKELSVRSGADSAGGGPGGIVRLDLVRYRREAVSEESLSVRLDPSLGKSGGEAGEAVDGGGMLVRVLGSLRVLSYDGESQLARARVEEINAPVQRGSLVANVPRSFARGQHVVSGINLDAVVVAALSPGMLQARGQLVFLDVGAEAGVVAGHRFQVLRGGDAWDRTLEENLSLSGSDATSPRKGLPDVVVGELEVLHVRAGSATALVTGSREALAIGDRARLRQGH